MLVNNWLNMRKNYTPFLVEMAAMTWPMVHFNTYLKGRHFTVFWDHKPLETSWKKHERTLNQIKEAFMEWDFTIQYEKGSEMPADKQECSRVYQNLR